MLALALPLLGSTAYAAVSPHASFHQLVSANGHTAAIYDDTQAKLTGLREHCYAAVDATVASRELAYDAYFGLRLNGTGKWLSETGVLPAVRYLPGTGIIESVQTVGSVQATTYVFAPFEASAPVALMLLKVKNTGSAALGAGDAAYSIHNLHVGDGPNQTQNEQIDWDAARGLFTERSGRVLVAMPLSAPSHHGCTPTNPYGRLNAGQDLADDSGSGKVDDAVSGLQWSLSGLAPGAEKWVGVAFGYHPFGNDPEIVGKITAWLAGRAVSALVADEESRWGTWHQTTVEPAGMSADEKALYRQQITVLRMGQVLEANDEASGYLPYGQVLASLPPGMWNITWVRDGMVAINALLRSGHGKEAKDGLAFFLKAKSGTYQSYVGAPYQISVVRYFGNGTEESDFNADGPNIEWDGFGMFLDGLDAYERATGDQQLATDHWDAITTKTADVLISLAKDDGLLVADSSIWETHWDNGARQHWTWSQVYGVLGLQAASAIAARHGKADLATKYAEAADSLRRAVLAKLVEGDGFLRSKLESTTLPEDAAVIEAFYRSVFEPAGSSSRATLERLKSKLAVASGHGFRRNLGPSEYDAREWIIVDLRMASVMRWLGDTAQSDALVSWVTAQSRANHDLIAENYNPTTADYEGSIPMVGFGAGAYVLALFSRNDTPVPPKPGPDAGIPDAAAPGADGATPAADGASPGATDGSSPGTGDGSTSSGQDGGTQTGRDAAAAGLDSGLHVLGDTGGTVGPGGSGCGCSTGGASAASALAPAAMLLLGLGARRRRVE
ncbi:MAG TPA: glycoside hydrolase family 15 protein [Myxococcales bacterium]